MKDIYRLIPLIGITNHSVVWFNIQKKNYLRCVCCVHSFHSANSESAMAKWFFVASVCKKIYTLKRLQISLLENIQLLQ